MTQPKLYGELASWWPLLSAPEDYAEEAAIYRQALVEGSRRPIRTLLELGSGGGNNASHLAPHFESMTLVDLSPGMLAGSRALTQALEHIQDDMRTVRLGRRFDAVLVHDAVVYMTTETDLRRAMETAYVHCEPGGAALFCPDCVRETFRAGTDTGGHDGDGRALRYLEWTYDVDPSDTVYQVDYAYVLHERGESPRVVLDRHDEGLFARDVWLRLLRRVGFEPRVVPLVHSEVEPGTVEMFVAAKPPE